MRLAELQKKRELEDMPMVINNELPMLEEQKAG
jgi:hypothetical protein